MAPPGRPPPTRDQVDDMIFKLITDIRTIGEVLRYRHNDIQLRETVKSLEKMLKPFRQHFSAAVISSVEHQSFKHIPVQADDDLKDYRREKARVLGQLGSYALKLLLKVDGPMGVTKELSAAINNVLLVQTSFAERSIKKGYPTASTPPEWKQIKERTEHYNEPKIGCYIELHEKAPIEMIIRAIKARKARIAEEVVRIADRAKEREKKKFEEEKNVKRNANEGATPGESSGETETSKPTVDDNLGLESNYPTPNDNTRSSQDSLYETPVNSLSLTGSADMSSKVASDTSLVPLKSAIPLSGSEPPAELSGMSNFEHLQSVESKTSEITGKSPKALPDLAAVTEITRSKNTQKDNSEEAVQDFSAFPEVNRLNNSKKDCADKAVQDLGAAPEVELPDEFVEDSVLIQQVQQPEGADDQAVDALQDIVAVTEGSKNAEKYGSEASQNPIAATKVEQAKDIEEDGSEAVQNSVGIPEAEEPTKATQGSVPDQQVEDPDDAEDNGSETSQKHVYSEGICSHVNKQVDTGVALGDGEGSSSAARNPNPERLEPLVVLFMRSKTLLIKERGLCDMFPRIESYLKEKKAKGEKRVDMDQLTTFLNTYGLHEHIRPLCFITFIKYIKGLEKVRDASRFDKIVGMEDLDDALHMLLLFLDPGTTLNLPVDEAPGILNSIELLAAILRVPSCFQVPRVLDEARYSNMFKVLKRLPKRQEYRPGGIIPEVESESDDSDSEADIPANKERSLKKGKAQTRSLASLKSTSTEEAYADFEEERQAEIAQKAHDRANAKTGIARPPYFNNSPSLRLPSSTIIQTQYLSISS